MGFEKMKMVKKPLTLPQCRFLGDQLQLEGFERLHRDSPLRFLEELVRGIRLHIPFNSLYNAAHLKRHGRMTSLTLSEAQSEIYSGRGGFCVLHGSFLEDFLRSIGFKAHIAFAFNPSKSFTRDSFHCAIFARDVEKEGDVYHLDTGTPPPCMRVTDVSKLLPWKEGQTDDDFAEASINRGGVDDKSLSSSATPILSGVQFQYQLLNGKQLLNAFHGTTSKAINGEFPNVEAVSSRRIASYIDVAELEADLQDDEDDSLVMMVAKNDIVAAIYPFFSEEEDDAWTPLHVFPAPWRPFDLEILRDFYRNPEVNLDLKLGRRAARGVNISGFGRKSGDYIFIGQDRLLRCVGSSAEANGRSSSTTTTARAPIRTELIKLESEEEVLAAVNEEFPLLTQDARDTFDIMAQIEGRSPVRTPLAL